jgi:hypothetical protein
MIRARLMTDLGWTSRQIEEENTQEDISKLMVYWDRLQKVEEIEKKEAEMKRKARRSRRKSGRRYG